MAAAVAALPGQRLIGCEQLSSFAYFFGGVVVCFVLGFFSLSAIFQL